jgi:hypothetical protein
MSRAERHTLAAMDVAQWLDEQGDHFRANAVRNVCRSLSVARVTMATLHRDNMDLRAARIETDADPAQSADRS